MKNKGSRTLIQVPPAAYLELFKYFQITPKAFKTRLFLISLIQRNIKFFQSLPLFCPFLMIFLLYLYKEETSPTSSEMGLCSRSSQPTLHR
nr:MAG TPA: hypothetical protein [Caudoviricetes sp.]